MSEQATFLKNPPEIRKAIYSLQKRKQLLLAVAFIGPDWKQLLADYKGPLRVVCWLSSTNTNPYAVANLMKRPQTEVRQRDSMHCKVYLAPKIGAIIGSANLSQAAPSEDISGQDEAAMLVKQPSLVAKITQWFEALWRDSKTRTIRPSDIAAAKQAYDKRLRGAPLNKRRRRDRPKPPPPPAQFDKRILAYADDVRTIDLQQDLKDKIGLVASIDPKRLTRDQQRELVAGIVSWTRHPGSYKTFLSQPISKVGTGLHVLFDNSVSVRSRLEDIRRDGLLLGLRMPSLSLLLYWKSPESFPPYNHRTRRFLEDFKLLNNGMSASSPTCYERWLEWAADFSQKLDLPTAGHVDRIVEQHYEADHSE